MNKHFFSSLLILGSFALILMSILSCTPEGVTGDEDEAETGPVVTGEYDHLGESSVTLYGWCDQEGDAYGI